MIINGSELPFTELLEKVLKCTHSDWFELHIKFLLLQGSEINQHVVSVNKSTCLHFEAINNIFGYQAQIWQNRADNVNVVLKLHFTVYLQGMCSACGANFLRSQTF